MKLPQIASDANKYSRGSLLVIAGSAQFSGAGILAAKAASRCGAGYVTLATPASVAHIAQSHLLTVPVVAAKDSAGTFAPDAWQYIKSSVNKIDAIVIGPGIGNYATTQAFCRSVLADNCAPAVIDADALNALTVAGLGGCAGHVLTPHTGELKRLLAASNTPNAKELAIKLKAIVVEKGPETFIVSGDRSESSNLGTAALAKAGTGDVLAGIIGALIAQGMALFEAALCGVELHSKAGLHAQELLGMRSVIALDLIDALPHVIKAADA